MNSEKATTHRKQKGLLGKVWKRLCAPGKHYAVRAAAVTQSVTIDKSEAVTVIGEILPAKTPLPESDSRSDIVFEDQKQISMGSRFFDYITSFAGSRFTFIVTLSVFFGWGIAGIVLGAPQNWQIAMSDGGSIQCYISDSLLMRQQQNQCTQLLTIIAQLRSRNKTFKRLLSNPEIVRKIQELKSQNLQMPQDHIGNGAKLPLEGWFDKLCSWVSWLIGSIYSQVFYWVAIFVWIGCGYIDDWSNLWQLYINTASAVQLSFTSMFLQHTRRIHMEYFEKCLKSVVEADCEVESLLRQVTTDSELNPMIEIQPLRTGFGVRAIDYYADLVGSGVGAFISTCVFIIWLAIGNVMDWNSNWWLIIGTYTGLIGYIDGFMLRNVYFRQDTIINQQFQELIDEDYEIFQKLSVEVPEERLVDDKSLIYKMSHFMGVVCSHPWSVLSSVLITIGLICVASGMLWNETGQLICNTPTMIIEGFLFNVLIQAHNVADTKRRVVIHNVLLRRLKLLQYVRPLSDDCEKKLVE
ncbi:Low affinity iron permease [Basidiobolus meristosporus CBS 931.73]|uniref:Low affinity iron permease n=1 Tax=Basidiobolus meristosporus CBS 931.73 TaxID=1314790 RepID=A0A1Y1VQQ9_9FUNG|nr:Low affinity iron permease [Basidiobolus meristosporus CBS 931.73]|eukprot:ORX63617.1 Low affinity iron permease [Basidiobolus meristosporus CBS 931.73]